jgi:hypothetical protein
MKRYLRQAACKFCGQSLSSPQAAGPHSKVCPHWPRGKRREPKFAAFHWREKRKVYCHPCERAFPSVRLLEIHQSERHGVRFMQS